MDARPGGRRGRSILGECRTRAQQGLSLLRIQTQQTRVVRMKKGVAEAPKDESAGPAMPGGMGGMGMDM